MRLALGVSYSGSAYQGWQSQSSRLAVQDVLEGALSKFCGTSVSTVCAGRTDSGVHALMQVVHLDTGLERNEFSWIRGTNRFLPDDVAVEWARVVPDDFHSRASAVRRSYCYILRESAVRPSIDSNRVGWVFRALDHAAMLEACQHLVGEHDFTSFRAAECQARSPVKTIHALTIQRRDVYWRFDFVADAFLYHMIRNIMGSLIQVGTGRRSPDWMREVLLACDRDAAAPTFSPCGLYFLGPSYASQWNLPEKTSAFSWLPL